MKANTQIVLFVITCLIALSGGLAYKANRLEKENVALAKQVDKLKVELLASELTEARQLNTIQRLSENGWKLVEGIHQQREKLTGVPVQKRVYAPDELPGE